MVNALYMVDIVIVNWNSGGYLATCINSIFSFGNDKYINKLYIIDNNSSDQSLLSIPLHEKIFIIRNPGNNGFAKACNQGFRLCSATYTLLLNPDAQLLDDTLQHCLAFMQQHNQVDILGCALIDEEGKLTPSCARFPTALRYVYDATGLSRMLPSVFTPAILMTDWDHKKSRKVNQVMGAFMFMPTRIFESSGYFDERFFVYYEELDFSKRVADAGGCSFYNAEIKAIHSGGGTTNAVKAFRLFLNLQSRLQYAKKHFSSIGYFVVWFCTFIIEPVSRTALILMQGRFYGIKEIIRGYQLLIKSRSF